MQLPKASYKAALQRALEGALRSADSASVTSLREEAKRFDESQTVPGTDSSGTPTAIISARATYRTSAAAAAAARASRHKQLRDSYDASLASLAGGLAGKPAEAAAVNAVRAKVTATLPLTPSKSNPPQ